MFRDDAQACRAIRALLSTASLEDLWSERGPTPRAGTLHRLPSKSLAAHERVFLQVAWTFWRPTQGRVRLGQVMRVLDRFGCEAVCSLLVAYKSGPDAIDLWLDDAATRTARVAEAMALSPAPRPEAVALVADWPTIDDLSIRYIHRVIEREGGNRTRAAVALGVDRRTLIRILAREERRRNAGRPRAA